MHYSHVCLFPCRRQTMLEVLVYSAWMKDLIAKQHKYRVTRIDIVFYCAKMKSPEYTQPQHADMTKTCSEHAFIATL